MNNKKAFSRNTFSNLGFLFFGGIIAAVSIFTTHVILARELTAPGYGNFMSAVALITLFSPLAVFGVPQVCLKLYGAEGEEANRWLNVSLKLVIFTSGFILLSLIFWAAYGPHNSDYKYILLGLLPLVISHIFIEWVNVRFQLEGRYFALTIWQNSMHLLRFLFIFFAAILFIRPLSMFQVLFGYFSISILVSLAGYFFLTPMFRGEINLGIPLSSEVQEIKKDQKELFVSDIFLHSLPFGLAGLFYLIYLQSDLIFLKYLVGEKASGIYAAAFAVMIAIYFIPGVIYQKFLLPKIHGWAYHDQPKLLKVYQGGNGIMLTLGLLIFVLFFFISPLIIPILFGNEYSETSAVLRILLFCVPIRFLATSVESPLFTKDLMKWKMGCMGIVALLNIMLNFILIPSFSYYGAAVATLLSEFVLLSLYLCVVHKKLFGNNTWLGWTSGFNKSFWQSL